jgi:hypothetical protein
MLTHVDHTWTCSLLVSGSLLCASSKSSSTRIDLHEREHWSESGPYSTNLCWLARDVPLIIVLTPASIGRDIRDSFPSRVGHRMFANQNAYALPKLKAPPEESPLNYTEAKLFREDTKIVTHQTEFFGILSGGQSCRTDESCMFPAK